MAKGKRIYPPFFFFKEGERQTDIGRNVGEKGKSLQVKYAINSHKETKQI